MVFTLVLLILVYALVLGSFAPADLAMGAVISGALMYGTRRFVFGEEPASPNILSRFLHFWPFLVAEIWNIVTGTWEVALVTLHLRPLVSPGIVAVPIGERTPVGVAVSAMATTLSPGTFLVDVDWEQNVMLIHALNASDPEEVRRDHQEFYERWQKKVFP
ncbi:MAG: Na+/H+ antiporter subunit E [Actinomycetota bacterium]|nr:Na+/H+ antiporter subunit E [Actinomycetota bacterium]